MQVPISKPMVNKPKDTKYMGYGNQDYKFYKQWSKWLPVDNNILINSLSSSIYKYIQSKNWFKIIIFMLSLFNSQNK